MGDRGQVKIQDEKIYLYTHWGATGLEDTVRRALKRGKARWSDPEYLARIIFSEMVKDDIQGLTGFGIGSHEHSDIWLLITINCKRQTIKVEDRKRHTEDEYTLKEFTGSMHLS